PPGPPPIETTCIAENLARGSEDVAIRRDARRPVGGEVQRGTARDVDRDDRRGDRAAALAVDAARAPRAAVEGGVTPRDPLETARHLVERKPSRQLDGTSLRRAQHLGRGELVEVVGVREGVEAARDRPYARAVVRPAPGCEPRGSRIRGEERERI